MLHAVAQDEFTFPRPPRRKLNLLSQAARTHAFLALSETSSLMVRRGLDPLDLAFRTCGETPGALCPVPCALCASVPIPVVSPASGPRTENTGDVPCPRTRLGHANAVAKGARPTHVRT